MNLPVRIATRSALAAATLVAGGLVLGLGRSPGPGDPVLDVPHESAAAPGPVGPGSTAPPRPAASRPDRRSASAPPARPARRPAPDLPAGEDLYAIAADPGRARENLPLLRRIAADETIDAGSRSLALWGLAGAGETGPSLEVLEGRGAAAVRVTAVEMLRRHLGLEAWAPLERAGREDREIEVRTAALLALADLDPTSAVAPLAGAATPGSPPAVRAAAIEALGRLDRPEALGAVLDAPATGPEIAWTRAAALFELRAHDPERVARALAETTSRTDLPSEIVERVRSLLLAATRGTDPSPCGADR